MLVENIINMNKIDYQHQLIRGDMAKYIRKFINMRGANYALAIALYSVFLFVLDIRQWFTEIGIDKELGVSLLVGLIVFFLRVLPGGKDKVNLLEFGVFIGLVVFITQL